MTSLKYYTLTKKGIKEVACYLNEELSSLPALPDPTIGNLEHLTITNDILSSMGSKFQYDWYQSELRYSFTGGDGKKIILSPDGAGSFRYKGKYTPFLLEVDRAGTKPAKQTFDHRVQKAEELKKRQEYSALFDFPPIILITASSESRMNKIQEAIEQSRKDANIFYLVTTHEKAIQEPLNPIWRIIGKEKTSLFSITQLGYKQE